METGALTLPHDPASIVAGVTLSGHIPVHEYRPLHASWEWRISSAYWSAAGVQPFSQSEVPFVITSSGQLSLHAAALFFQQCVAANPEGEIAVLEVGAGTGLFARYFLDAFRDICQQEGRGYYEQLTYVASDGSPSTVEHWMACGLFGDHEAHVLPGVLDASNVHGFTPVRGTRIMPATVSAVFCNYVLDILPATVVRRGASGLEELQLRARIPPEQREKVAQLGFAKDEVAGLFAAADDEALRRLAPLLDLVEHEASFRACSTPPAFAAEALDALPAREIVTVNHGALAFLDDARGLLAADGFILVNDYGPVSVEGDTTHTVSQRFGRTSAIGLDFVVLKALLERRELAVVVPEGDGESALHARLLVRDSAAPVVAAFLDRFGPSSQAFYTEPATAARQHIAAGRHQEALDAYRVALERNARDWYVVAEAAEFVGLTLREYAAGLELARSAVALNPWYSPWVLNILGDCFYCLEQWQEAHEAYLQAFRINPRDVRTNLNLAFSYAQRGAVAEALEAAARGLAHDGNGAFQRRLLEQQQRILGQLVTSHADEEERRARRASRLQAAAVEASPSPLSVNG